MKYYWTTKDGETIDISEMKTNHIQNCIAMIDRKAKNGVNVVVSLGYAPDNDYIEYEEYTIYGKDVYEHFGTEYRAMKRELKKRLL